MKNVMLIAAIATMTASVQAAEFGIASVHDYDANKNGTRVSAQLSSKMFGVAPTISATLVENAYNRYAIGGKLELAKVGPLTLDAVGSGVYQDSVGRSDGYALTAGVAATYKVNDTVSVTAGIEQQRGQDRIESFNGNTTSVGVKINM